MVFRIKPAESKNPLVVKDQQNKPESDVPEKTKFDVQGENIITSQIKLELLFHRIGNCCFILSIILFIGQVSNSALQKWEMTISSTITGFGFSFFLFMSWACIYSVYGKRNSGVR